MFPTVATVYGLGLDESNSGLVATLALDQSVITSSQNCSSRMSVSSRSFNIKAEKPIQNMLSNIQTSDPVTKALIDNVTGKLDTKKKPVMCEVCNLELSGPLVLSEHNRGAKHKRMIALKEKNIVSSSTDTSVTVANPSNPTKGLELFPCDVCNLKLNSRDQLAVHLTGKVHSKKLAAANGQTVNRSANPVVGTTTSPPALKNGAQSEPTTNESTPSSTTLPDPTPLPEGVTKSVTADNITVYTCTICNKWVNSIGSLNDHLRSRKHLNKANPQSAVNSRWKPYSKTKIASQFKTFKAGGILGDDNPANYSTSYPKFDPKYYGIQKFNSDSSTNQLNKKVYSETRKSSYASSQTKQNMGTTTGAWRFQPKGPGSNDWSATYQYNAPQNSRSNSNTKFSRNYSALQSSVNSYSAPQRSTNNYNTPQSSANNYYNTSQNAASNYYNTPLRSTNSYDSSQNFMNSYDASQRSMDYGVSQNFINSYTASENLTPTFNTPNNNKSYSAANSYYGATPTTTASSWYSQSNSSNPLYSRNRDSTSQY